jgi:stage III sporulation protein AG
MGPQFDLKKLYEWVKNPKNKLFPNIMIIFAIGFLLLSLNKFIPSGQATKNILHEEKKEEDIQNLYSQQEENYKKKIENQLSEVLEKVDDVGTVSVMITLQNEELIETAFNMITNEKTSEEKDNEGGVRTIVETQSNKQVVIINKDGKDEPVIIKKATPEIRGVLIVAEGASSSQVKQKLINAASILLDIPVHKISVLANKGDF